MHHNHTARAGSTRPIFATLALLASFLLTVSCGEHSFDEWLGLDSSSSEGELNGSSSSKVSSSSRLGSSSSLVANVSSDSHPGVVVGPLLQTKWNQESPYNDLFPIVNGEHVVTNCGTTAMVQIMKFHNYPARGKGESSVVTTTGGDFTVPLTSLDVAYDWDNMLNEYTSRNPGTEQQRLAVATLFYHFGLAKVQGVNGDFNALVNHFGYDKSFQKLERKYYSDAEWEAVIRQQLDLGLPVSYIAAPQANDDPESISTVSHVVVVDGYDNAGKFHLNWGWGGSSDGWYSLNAINLSNGQRYNYNHWMLINIKPDAGSIGSNEMAVDSFTVSKTTVSQNNEVTVIAKIKSTGFFLGGQAGVALVNNSGNIVAVIGTVNYVALGIGVGYTSTIKCFVPDSVNAGKYNLRIVTKMNNGEWKIATRFLQDIPKSIPFNVTEPGTKGDGYGLTLVRFNTYPETGKTTASRNEEFTIEHTLSDTLLTIFPAGVTSGVALMDESDNIVAILGTLEIPSNRTNLLQFREKINCKVPSTVAPGQYKLRIVVKTKGNDEWRAVTSVQKGYAPPTSIDFTIQKS